MRRNPNFFFRRLNCGALDCVRAQRRKRQIDIQRPTGWTGDIVTGMGRAWRRLHRGYSTEQWWTRDFSSAEDLADFAAVWYDCHRVKDASGPRKG